MPCCDSFRFINSWQGLTDADAQAIRDFWRREQAQVDGENARRRLAQVVMRVLTTDGELAAVSTAVPMFIARLQQPLYYYRCFIGAAWRRHQLLRPLLCESFNILEAWARERAFPCIGVLLELENAAFAHALRKPYWRARPDMVFNFIGHSDRGLDLRVCYFRGARLKTAAEIQALKQQQVDLASAAQSAAVHDRARP